MLKTRVPTTLIIIISMTAIFLNSRSARAEIAGGVLCTLAEPCGSRGLFTRSSAGPSKSDSIKVNPAAVPVEKITGIETVYYDGSFDFGLVKGLGRVGAAITPSNNEETFFGAPGTETFNSFAERMIDKKKFKSTKYTLAGAANLFSTGGEGLMRTTANLGLMGRYYQTSGHVTPGTGLQFTTGPILIAASIYRDENTVTDPLNGVRSTGQSNVTSWNAGLFLNSVMLDYSVIQTAGLMPAKASVATLTGFIGKRSIITLARRSLISDKPSYDFTSKSFEFLPETVDWFASFQFRVAPFLVLGVHYNYYLLHEASFGVVMFF